MYIPIIIIIIISNFLLTKCKCCNNKLQIIDCKTLKCAIKLYYRKVGTWLMPPLNLSTLSPWSIGYPILLGYFF